jgi:hypothetical protein
VKSRFTLHDSSSRQANHRRSAPADPNGGGQNDPSLAPSETSAADIPVCRIPPAMSSLFAQLLPVTLVSASINLEAWGFETSG